MHKIALIIKREYFTRVKKKMFIITTLLLPVFYALMIFGTGYIARQSQTTLKVAVIDESGFFSNDQIAKQNPPHKNIPKTSGAQKHNNQHPKSTK